MPNRLIGHCCVINNYYVWTETASLKALSGNEVMHVLYFSDVIDLTRETASIKSPKYWIQDLCLFLSDKKCIAKGRWLNDNIIRATQELIKKAYPGVGGLQSPILGENFSFAVQKGEFVQILHVYGSHWLTVSNIGCPPGQINVYDSIPNCELYSRSKCQISTILHSKKTKIDVAFMDVQMQSGASDCGLFALAFAMSLCAGDNPSQVQYVQHSMRDHLLACIEKRAITAFPQRVRRRRKLVRNRISFKIYCYCRGPQYGEMIACSACDEWFHRECVRAPSKAWSNVSFKWTCDSCKP